MLMDEATAVLDASTSKAVTASILDIPELTKIVATHRLEPSILSRYDEIVVVKNGRICETGTFADPWIGRDSSSHYTTHRSKNSKVPQA